MGHSNREFSIVLAVMALTTCLMMVFATLWYVAWQQEESAAKQVERLKAELRVQVNKFYNLQEHAEEAVEQQREADSVAKWQLTEQLAQCTLALADKKK